VITGSSIIFVATNVMEELHNKWVAVQTCYNRDFVLVLKKKQNDDGSPQHFYFIVELVGNVDETEDFAYKSVLRDYLFAIHFSNRFHTT
jgi:hypothetical protein